MSFITWDLDFIEVVTFCLAFFFAGTPVPFSKFKALFSFVHTPLLPLLLTSDESFRYDSVILVSSSEKLSSSLTLKSKLLHLDALN